MFGVSKVLYILFTFTQQGCIKLIKSVNKDIYNVTKDFYFKENFINSSKNPEKKNVSWFPQKYESAQVIST